MLLQIVVPHGLSASDPVSYVIAAVTIVLLGVAMWRYYRGRR
jgi:hypothetical protein